MMVNSAPLALNVSVPLDGLPLRGGGVSRNSFTSGWTAPLRRCVGGFTSCCSLRRGAYARVHGTASPAEFQAALKRAVPPPHAQLEVGAKVQLHPLHATEHNGKHGELLEYDPGGEDPREHCHHLHSKGHCDQAPEIYMLETKTCVCRQDSESSDSTSVATSYGGLRNVFFQKHDLETALPQHQKKCLGLSP